MWNETNGWVMCRHEMGPQPHACLTVIGTGMPSQGSDCPHYMWGSFLPVPVGAQQGCKRRAGLWHNALLSLPGSGLGPARAGVRGVILTCVRHGWKDSDEPTQYMPHSNSFLPLVFPWGEGSCGTLLETGLKEPQPQYPTCLASLGLKFLPAPGAAQGTGSQGNGGQSKTGSLSHSCSHTPEEIANRCNGFQWEFCFSFTRL